jgi:hypothetical protein
MPRVGNWKAPVNAAQAFKRAGKRRQWLKQKKLEVAERRKKFAQVCIENNFPFFGKVRDITAKFIEVMQAENPGYYLSHYTAVYDLQAIFGKDYAKTYRIWRKAEFLDYPAEILALLDEGKRLNEEIEARNAEKDV